MSGGRYATGALRARMACSTLRVRLAKAGHDVDHAGRDQLKAGHGRLLVRSDDIN